MKTKSENSAMIEKWIEKKTRKYSFLENQVPSSTRSRNDQNSNPNVVKEKRVRKSRRLSHLEVKKKICIFHLKKCERNIFSAPHAFIEKLKHVVDVDDPRVPTGICDTCRINSKNYTKIPASTDLTIGKSKHALKKYDLFML